MAFFLLFAVMKFLLLLFGFCVFLSFSSPAQSPSVPKLIWKVDRINLGTLLEEEGIRTAEFEFTVTQSAPFHLVQVSPECGCTAVSFSKDTLALGQSGSIKVSFDPSSSAGYFSKLILVQGGGTHVQDSIYLEGISIPYPTDLEQNYPVKIGSLGFRMKKISMGDVFDNEPKVKFIEFFNHGTSSLEKEAFTYVAPAYIKLEPLQDKVRPQERGLIQLTYDASQRPELGAVVDLVTFNWNKNADSSVQLEVLADLFDYFAPITKDQLDEVPQLFISQKIIELGEINSSTVIRKSVELKNLGKKNLELRKIQGNCECLVVEPSKNSLAPGEQMELMLTFDPVGRKGIDHRNIYLFTNDPVNPVQSIVIKSKIE
ncbi:MAG: DUF1573 domain-containing protein [Algoriphagus sp.]